MSWLIDEIRSSSPKEVFNNNDAYFAWLRDNITLEDVFMRVSDIESLVFEEFTNDWHEAIEETAAELGMDIDELGDIVSDEDDGEEDEDE